MLLALLADTHDDVGNTHAALKLLRPHGPAAYLHAGDLVSPAMLSLFESLPFHFVFGNNEYDHAAIKSQAHALGLHCHGELAELEFLGHRIGLLHGDDGVTLRRLVDSQQFAYIVHGHTHVRKDARVGRTRIINPGAVHRAKVKSVALLNLANDSLDFHEIPPP